MFYEKVEVSRIRMSDKSVIETVVFEIQYRSQAERKRIILDKINLQPGEGCMPKMLEWHHATPAKS